MIVRTIDDIKTDRERSVETHTFGSYRFLTRMDGMGFSLSETILHAGAVLKLWYKHHVEACYVMEGEAELEVLAPTAATYRLRAGSMYAPNAHDRHILRVEKRMRLVCVFNPPLTGREVHDADGSYLPAGN